MKTTNTTRKPWRIGAKTLLAAGVILVAVPASGWAGGAQLFEGYIGPLPVSWFDGEPCHNGTITVTEDFAVLEYQVDVSGVRDDGDPNTYVRCNAFGRFQQLTCIAGLSDGTVVGCHDPLAPHVLPRDGDIVYLQFDPEGPEFCSIQIGNGDNFGTADPKCRESAGSGGGGGGGGGPSVCNAQTAAAILNHGQVTNIASNACVQLKNEASWSTIDPSLQPQAGTAAYPVPFSYQSCAGTGTGTFTGNWQSVYLFNGPGSAPNPGCDIFVKLQGDGSQVTFAYYE